MRAARLATFTQLLLCILATGAATAMAPQAAVAVEVDCAQITMKFTDPGYAVDCEAESETLRANTATGGGQTEFLNATANDESHFLFAYDIRASGDIYYTHQSLYNRTKNSFPDMEMKNWSKKEDFAGFEVGEFNGLIRSHPSECVAFQRAVNPTRNGYRRAVFGFGCSLEDRNQVYDALKLLDAPGD